jgi:hypothetical protein
LREIEQEYTALYKAADPPGNPLPVHYAPVPISDDIPSEEEILVAVRKLKPRKAPGPSSLQNDDIKKWAREREEEPAARVSFVQLVEHCFTQQEVPKMACFSTLVLIPKADGGVQGIGLLESVWKVVSMIIKNRMAVSISFDITLHGFQAHRGTGTAILEARLHLDQ